MHVVEGKGARDFDAVISYLLPGGRVVLGKGRGSVREEGSGNPGGSEV